MRNSVQNCWIANHSATHRLWSYVRHCQWRNSKIFSKALLTVRHHDKFHFQVTSLQFAMQLFYTYTNSVVEVYVCCVIGLCVVLYVQYWMFIFTHCILLYIDPARACSGILKHFNGAEIHCPGCETSPWTKPYHFPLEMVITDFLMEPNHNTLFLRWNIQTSCGQIIFQWILLKEMWGFCYDGSLCWPTQPPIYM